MISMGTWCEWCLENRRYTLCCSHIKEQQNTKGPLWRNCRAARMVCSFEPQPRTFTYAKLSTVLLIMCYTYLCLKLTTDWECNIQFYSFFLQKSQKLQSLFLFVHNRRKRRSSSTSSHSSTRRRRSRSAERDKGRSHRSHRSRSRDKR